MSVQEPPLDQEIEEGHRRLQDIEKELRRKRIKRIVLVLLLILLFLLALILFYYLRTREVPIPSVETTRRATVTPPRALFYFDGSPKTRLQRPTDVKVHPQTGNVYVTDLGNHRVAVFDSEGNFLFDFKKVNKGRSLIYPHYLTFDKKGNVWVTDKSLEGIFVFSPSGRFIKEFSPKFPQGKGKNWQPEGLYFGEDGLLYVTEIQLNHQVYVIDPKSRKILLRIGKIGGTLQEKKMPGYFAFPNSVATLGKNIYVSDSTNRRLQVFNKETGKFKKILATGGHPRGIDFGYKNRLHIVDAIGHKVLVYTPDNNFLLSFGEIGNGLGQTFYPNGIDCNGRYIYVADTWNHRISVWSWPLEVAPPRLLPKLPFPWWVLLPLLLLPLLWYYLRRKYVAHEDFLTRLIGEQKVRKLAKKVKRIFVIESVYKKLEGYVEGDYEIRWLLRIGKYRQSDVEKLKDAYPLSDDEAILLATCYRQKRKVVLFVEEEKLRQIADKLGVVSMNYEEAAKHFHLKD